MDEINEITPIIFFMVIVCVIAFGLGFVTGQAMA